MYLLYKYAYVYTYSAYNKHLNGNVIFQKIYLLEFEQR